MTDELSKLTILAVDDTPENIDILVGILREQYKVKAAPNGERALTVASKSPPDLILLDIMMPVMDGFETCRKLKESPETQDIPVIFLTAKTETEDIVKGFELGAVDYLTKPFNATELQVRVNTHLQLRLAQKQLQESLTIQQGLNDNLMQKTSELQMLANKLSIAFQKKKLQLKPWN